MFENRRRGRQARNFTTNVPKILDLKSSSEQIFSENWRWVPLILLSQGLHESLLDNWYNNNKRVMFHTQFLSPLRWYLVKTQRTNRRGGFSLHRNVWSLVLLSFSKTTVALKRILFFFYKLRLFNLHFPQFQLILITSFSTFVLIRCFDLTGVEMDL